MDYKLPTELSKAIQNDNLLIFVGAGLSKKFDLPNWNELVVDLIDSLNDESVNNLRNVVGNPVPAIDILDYLKKYKKETFNYIQDKFILEEGLDFETHKKIISLSGKIITTNYDNAFEEADRGIYTAYPNSTFKVASLTQQEKYIFKLHGCVKDDPAKCVLFKEDYEHLYSKENAVIYKLKELFINKAILFIGFSFNDPYVTNLFDSIDKIFEGFGSKHYLITVDTKGYERFGYLEAIKINDYSDIDTLLDEMITLKQNSVLPIKQTLPIGNENHKIKIAFLHPDPIDIKLDVETNFCFRCLDGYDIDVHKGYLNVDTLQKLSRFDYVIIVTKTFKGKVYIEDENLKSKLVLIDELVGYILDEDCVKMIIADSSVIINELAGQVLIVKNNKKDIVRSVFYKVFQRTNLVFSDTDVFHNIKNLPSPVGKGKKVEQNIYGGRQLDFVNSKIGQALVGRVQDQLNIASLLIDIQSSNKVLNIKGSGGIGKTTIIKKVSYDLYNRGYFNEGIVFCSCENIKSYDEFESIAAGGFKLENISDFKNYLLENSYKRDLLIILDNFETITNVLTDEESIFAVELLNFLSDYASIVITSRERIGSDFEDEYALPPLSTDAAYELFKRNYKFNETEENIHLLRVDILENLLNNNPLAIKLVTNNTVSTSISELYEQLKNNFFESTSENEFAQTYKDAIDINIEKTKSLYHCINYSFDKLLYKEKLAFELLHLFPDGINVRQFKKWFNKGKGIKDISDREFKHLEDKSLIEIEDGIIQLQPIIRKFAEFQFKKRKTSEKQKYYIDAYGYNCHILDVVEYINTTISYSSALKFFDKFKNNLLLVTSYFDKIEVKENSSVPEKKFLLNYLRSLNNYFVSNQLFEEYLSSLKSVKEFFSDIEFGEKILKVMELSLIYYVKRFDSIYEQISILLPVQEMETIAFDEESYIKRHYIDIIGNIHSMEGHTMAFLKYKQNTNYYIVSDYNHLFYLGVYGDFFIDKNFYYYEFQLIKGELFVDELQNYIDCLFAEEHLEKLQATYTLSKVINVDKDTINKLVVTNPYTRGLKEIMFAFCESNYTQKKIYFENGLKYLEHIKYFYLDALYYYCSFLKENGDSAFEYYFNLGKDMSSRLYYQYLHFKFDNILNTSNQKYQCIYDYYHNFDMTSFVKNCNINFKEYVENNKYLTAI